MDTGEMALAASGTKGWRRPTRKEALDFWARSRVLIALRWLRGVGTRERWDAGDALKTAPIVAMSRTPLWNDDDGEFVLTAGKVHNLRVTVKAFHGVVVPANACLSFWRQLGRPSARRGFVIGREVRDGCVIPTIAGGICQLSNALATCASRAGFELVEHHRHSASVARGDASTVDATVFWNYIDLRIRAPFAWRLETTLSADELIVIVRAEAAQSERISTDGSHVARLAQRSSASIRNCFGCDETSCFRHRKPAQASQAREAWLLDAWTPELAHDLEKRDARCDRLIPVSPAALRHQWLRRGAPKNDWSALSGNNHRAWLASLRRIIWLRLWANRAGRRQASILDGQRWLAQAYARRLCPEHTHLVVDQGLLPHLQLLGTLDGRSYEVLATQLPMIEIERRLDEACAHAAHNQPARSTLSDFRAPMVLAEAELLAMSRAQSVTTAHTDVASYWREHPTLEVRCVPWMLPPNRRASVRDQTQARDLPLVVFPASALARKGAYVLAHALRGFPCRLRVLGSPSDDDALWKGLDVEHANYSGDWMSPASVVVLPAYIEHSPRAALAAVATGIPVIATAACGIEGLPGVIVVPCGNVDALRAALSATLQVPD